MDSSMLFDSWESLLRVPLIGGAAYIALVVMLRISGKRTLSKMNAFDLVVTVALGSTLATVLLDRDVPLADGVAALGLLVFLQYVITWGSVRSSRLQHLVKSDATALVRDGRYLRDAMRDQRVTEEEIVASLRQHGVAGIEDVSLAMLETDGSLSIVPKSAGS